MNARIAKMEAMAIEAMTELEDAQELAVEEWIRSTGGTCGIVPVDSCAADSPSAPPIRSERVYRDRVAAFPEDGANRARDGWMFPLQAPERPGKPFSIDPLKAGDTPATTTSYRPNSMPGKMQTAPSPMPKRPSTRPPAKSARPADSQPISIDLCTKDQRGKMNSRR